MQVKGHYKELIYKVVEYKCYSKRSLVNYYVAKIHYGQSVKKGLQAYENFLFFFFLLYYMSVGSRHDQASTYLFLFTMNTFMSCGGMSLKSRHV